MMISRLTELIARRDRYLINIAYFSAIVEDITRDIRILEERRKVVGNGKALPPTRRK